VAPFAGAALAAVNDYRRRRWEARFSGVAADEGAPASATKSFVREIYALAATDDQLAAVEAALRAAELERKRLLDAAKRRAADGGQPGGSESSSSNAASRS